MAYLRSNVDVFTDSWKEWDDAPGQENPGAGDTFKRIRIGDVHITVFSPSRTREQEATSRKNGGA